jgi:2-polyprenyl-6-methoxyphenol hydroxylase-like FAD-dependent oxidoreductase
MRGRAEIVGGGLAGLAAAVSLARRGWTVRIHERAAELREIGAGLYLKENGLRALDDMGVSAAALARAVPLVQMDVGDMTSGRTLTRDVQGVRVYAVLRTDLHRAMAAAAAAAGAELVTESVGVEATPEGTLTLRKASQGGGSSQEIRADLVVGADGVFSSIRRSLGLGVLVKTLPEGATRLLVARRPGERGNRSAEYWGGRNRLLITPCSPDDLYVALMGPEDDRRARAVPVATARWAELFPRHQDLLSRIDPGRATHHTNAHVKVRGWSSGRACILGDAAHGQPPNLGQGAGLALSNAVELAACLDSAATVEEGLARWEARWMPVATMVQQWSYWYGVLAYRWPAPLRRARLSALRALTTFGPTRRRYTWLWQGGLDDTRQVPIQIRLPRSG